MDSADKKIKSIMTETLKELVVPRLEKIEKKLDAILLNRRVLKLESTAKK